MREGVQRLGVLGPQVHASAMRQGKERHSLPRTAVVRPAPPVSAGRSGFNCSRAAETRWHLTSNQGRPRTLSTDYSGRLVETLITHGHERHIAVERGCCLGLRKWESHNRPDILKEENHAPKDGIGLALRIRLQQRTARTPTPTLGLAKIVA